MDVAATSSETSHLDGPSRERYIEKLSQLNIADPYNIPADLFTDLLSCKFGELPDFGYPDLYNYLVFNPSPYTGEDLKAYKGLDAYKYFVAGWVTNLRQWRVESKDLHIVVARVTHSQRLSDAQVRPWVAIKRDGQVLCAHCTCMAGLGEACSHIAAVLFGLEAAVRHIKAKTCTDVPQQWGFPSMKTAIKSGKPLFAATSAINFTRPEQKIGKRCMPGPSNVPSLSITPSSSTKTVPQVPQVTPEEKAEFYSRLHQSGVKCGILSITPGYGQNFIPKSVHLPASLTMLYKQEYVSMPYPELVDLSEQVFGELAVDQAQADSIEEGTRTQAKSKLWFRQRAGRVTASRFKAAARTDPASPSPSLIKQICYPQSYKFATQATQWGCDHEAVARQAYEAQAGVHHTDLEVTDCGLFINPAFPHLAATPDGLVKCSCCGPGLLEIKCPFCARDCALEEAVADKGFCLETQDGGLSLKKDHAYYYQVQAQLHITGRPYCEFVVWTEASQKELKELFVERITPDASFFQKALDSINLMYKLGVLPELLGKWYTRSAAPQPVTQQSPQQTYCYCKAPANDNAMVQCSAATCSIKQFHLKCLGLKNAPRRKTWMCPDCRKLKNVKGKAV